jgi:hypothetical protein
MVSDLDLAVKNYVLPWVLFAIAAVFYLFVAFPEMVFLTQPDLWEVATGRTYIKAVPVAYAVLVPWIAMFFMLDQPKAAALNLALGGLMIWLFPGPLRWLAQHVAFSLTAAIPPNTDIPYYFGRSVLTEGLFVFYLFISFAILVPWPAWFYRAALNGAIVWPSRSDVGWFFSRVVPVYVGTVAAGLVIPPAMRVAGYFWPDISVPPSFVWVSVLLFLSGATSLFLCALVLWFLFCTNPARRR